MGGWHPWGELRRRVGVLLAWAEIDGARGLWWPNDDGTRTITLDVRLGRRERRCVLGHELVHDERGITYDADTPPALVEKEEAIVDREATRRLVPLDELHHLAVALDELGESVTISTVMEAFDVDHPTARRALQLLDASSRHPSRRTSR